MWPAAKIWPIKYLIFQDLLHGLYLLVFVLKVSHQGTLLNCKVLKAFVILLSELVVCLMLCRQML